MRLNPLPPVLTALLLVLAPGAWCAPKYKVLHAFTGGSDGGTLWGSLLLDSQEHVYGTTFYGGSAGGGTVFELTPAAGGGWAEITLWSFDGADGAAPTAGLAFDISGNLYGTTQGGGINHDGTVFELTLQGGSRTESILHSFQAGGCCPYAGVTGDNAGNLYGTAGNAYELSPGSDGWSYNVLHPFCEGDDGCDAYAGVIRDAAGNLYGTTEHGGSVNRCGGGCGTVYRLHPMSDGSWKEVILHSFGASGDGAFPGVGALAMDESGSLYGTTDSGVIFKLTKGAHARWKETILYNITGGQGGTEPSAGVVLGKSGEMYGTTIAGGDPNCDCGVVYKLAPRHDGKWKYTVLHRFTGFDGAQPDANLILDRKGNLYGTTAIGGSAGNGVAFELTP